MAARWRHSKLGRLCDAVSHTRKRTGIARSATARTETRCEMSSERPAAIGSKTTPAETLNFGEDHRLSLRVQPAA